MPNVWGRACGATLLHLIKLEHGFCRQLWHQQAKVVTVLSNQASLLVGGPGTAKTSIINQFMGRFTPEETTSKTITFSSLTTPAIFQTAVEVKISLEPCHSNSLPKHPQQCLVPHNHGKHVFLQYLAAQCSGDSDKLCPCLTQSW